MERGDQAAAERAYGAAQEILEGNLEASYWYAVSLCNAGEHERAIEIFQEIFAEGENWRRLTPRLVESGFLEADQSLLERILED